MEESKNGHLRSLPAPGMLEQQIPATEFAMTPTLSPYFS